jgi:hypothetical protein
MGYPEAHVAGYGAALFTVPGREYRSFYVTGTGQMQEYRFEPTSVPTSCAADSP